MEIKFIVPEWHIEDIIREEISKAVTERVELLCNDDIAQAISATIIRRIAGFSISAPDDKGAIAKILDSKIAEIVKGIEDDFLKNVILERLVSKLN